MVVVQAYPEFCRMIIDKPPEGFNDCLQLWGERHGPVCLSLHLLPCTLAPSCPWSNATGAHAKRHTIILVGWLLLMYYIAGLVLLLISSKKVMSLSLIALHPALADPHHPHHHHLSHKRVFR